MHVGVFVLFQWLRRVDSVNPANNGTVRIGNEMYIVLSGAYKGELVSRHDGTYMSRLTIRNVTERHTGFYVCYATNTDGFNSVGAYMQLKSPPKSPSESTLLLNADNTRSLPTAEKQRVSCACLWTERQTDGRIYGQHFLIRAFECQKIIQHLRFCDALCIARSVSQPR